MYKQSQWLTDEQISSLFSADYWNNEEIEKNKYWSLWNSNFEELQNTFLGTGLLKQFESIVQSENIKLSEKQIFSLASGICLLEANILNKNHELKIIRNLEFSKHRIFNIAPNIFEKLNIPPSKVELILGSFLDLKVPSESVDIVLLSQAFHHCFEPDKLLTEISRVLKPNGVVIIIGEHYFNPLQVVKRIIKHPAKYLLNHRGTRKRGKLIPSWRCLFPIDQEKGDHHYNMKQYQKFFLSNGFEYKRFIFSEYKNQGFLLNKLSGDVK